MNRSLIITHWLGGATYPPFFVATRLNPTPLLVSSLRVTVCWTRHDLHNGRLQHSPRRPTPPPPVSASPAPPLSFLPALTAPPHSELTPEQLDEYEEVTSYSTSTTHHSHPSSSSTVNPLRCSKSSSPGFSTNFQPHQQAEAEADASSHLP